MDELQTSDELTFIPESIEPICLDVIEAILKDKTYNDTLVQGWIDEICSRITKELIQTNKPFKYAGTSSSPRSALLVLNTSESTNLTLASAVFSIVTCTVMQKNGAGLHVGYSCFWDTSNDNTVVARWPSERRKDPNARVVCIVTVFGIAY